MLSAIAKQNVRNRLHALDDEALIEEAARLRALMPDLPPKLERKIDALLDEAKSDLSKPFRPGVRRDARGRLRSFCLAELTRARD
jgi:hypothetical protein